MATSDVTCLLCSNLSSTFYPALTVDIIFFIRIANDNIPASNVFRSIGVMRHAACATDDKHMLNVLKCAQQPCCRASRGDLGRAASTNERQFRRDDVVRTDGADGVHVRLAYALSACVRSFDRSFRCLTPTCFVPNEGDFVLDHCIDGELLEVVHRDDGDGWPEGTRQFRDRLVENHFCKGNDVRRSRRCEQRTVRVFFFGSDDHARPLLTLVIEMFDKILVLQFDEILKHCWTVAFDVSAIEREMRCAVGDESQSAHLAKSLTSIGLGNACSSRSNSFSLIESACLRGVFS